MTSGVIVTAAGPHMSSLMHELSGPSFESYADRWGWDVRAVDLDADGSQADPAAQRAHLHPGHFQALALEHVPVEHRVNPNTGVWLMRSCPAAFAFLDAVEAVGPQPGPWADQGAVLAALGWHRGDELYHWARPGRGTRFLAGTSWLPGAWNQPYLEGRTAESCYGATDSYVGRPTVPDPYAIHFMGMTTAARRLHMAPVAARTGTGRDRAAAPSPSGAR